MVVVFARNTGHFSCRRDGTGRVGGPNLAATPFCVREGRLIRPFPEVNNTGDIYWDNERRERARAALHLH